MAIGNFPPCLQAVWQFDGIKDDSAPGERFITTWGITEMTYNEAIRQGVIPPHLQALATPDDARAILKALYWDKAQCDKLPLGVDLMTFNMAMLGGVSSAVKVLQQAVGTTPDGVIGPHTLGAVSTAQPINIVKLQYLYDLEHLRSLRNWPTFQNGWTRRENVMVGLARKMIAGGGGAVPSV